MLRCGKVRIAYHKHAYYLGAMDRDFAFEVAETAQVMRRDFDRRASALGATRAQWRVLARLARQDGQRQVELAEALDVEPITLSRMVDRLSDAGLVERRADGQDRRAWRVHLTAKAWPLIEQLQIRGDAFLATALSGLSEADQAVARRVLATVRANLSGDAATDRKAS